MTKARAGYAFTHCGIRAVTNLKQALHLLLDSHTLVVEMEFLGADMSDPRTKELEKVLTSERFRKIVREVEYFHTYIQSIDPILKQKDY